MKEATVLKEVTKSGKTITRKSNNMNWVKLDSGNSLFWITSGTDASCLCVEGNGWEASLRTVKHLQSVL